MIGQKFVFRNVGLDSSRHEISFYYQIVTNDEVFDLQEKITFPTPISDTAENQKLIRALHIALGISYYKSFIPPTIEHPYEMTEIEADFWNTVYKNGLGEFLYTNQLPAERLAKFQAQSGEKFEGNDVSTWDDKVILGIGGGKDSIVAGELLKEIGLEVEGFVLASGENSGQTKEVSDVMGINLSVINRVIDSKILEINKLEGSYNGHIPISVIFALCGCLLASAKGHKYVVVANEASASIPQTTWENLNINHQWSKSIEFERLFQDYLRAYVSPEINYFSAVRPLSSVAIAKIFANYPAYFEVFSSDNSLLKIKQEARLHPRWSPDSTKSLSSFILLAPWMNDDDLMRTFGRNFLDDSSLENMCGALLGENGQVVLDCVGTSEELKASLVELVRQNRFLNSKLVTYTKDKQLLSYEKIADFLRLDEHAIPESIKSNIIAAMEEKL